MEIFFLSFLKARTTRSADLASEIRDILSRPVKTERDMKRLAELRLELLELRPPFRYAWDKGNPVVDIWAEITNLQGGKT